MKSKISQTPLSSAWTVAKRQVSIFTGGSIEAAPESDLLLGLCNKDVAVASLSSGTRRFLLQEHLPVSLENPVFSIAYLTHSPILRSYSKRRSQPFVYVLGSKRW